MIEPSSSRTVKDLQDDIKQLHDLIEFQHSQLKSFHKQLKGKVSRNEFISGMSSKVSLSQMSTFNLCINEKENAPANKKDETLPALINYTIIEEAMKQMEKRISLLEMETKNEAYRSNEFVQLLKKDFASQISRIQSTRKQKTTDLQCYIYQKADRSQIDKLFKLNQLLVIEIEQAKRHCHNLESKFREQKTEEKSEMKSLCNAVNDYLQKVNGLEKKQTIMKQQINQMRDLNEMKENLIQNTQMRQNSFYESISRKTEELHEQIKRVNEEFSWRIKDISHKLTSLQVKETQNIRTSTQVDILNGQMSTIRGDLETVVGKIKDVSQQSLINCSEMISIEVQKVCERVGKEIEATCEELMKKMLILLNDTPTNNELHKLLNPIERQIQEISENKSKSTMKMAQLTKKIDKLEEDCNSNEDKVEEQIARIERQVGERVKTKELKEALKIYLCIDEGKNYIRELQSKVNTQIKRIITEQHKINEVLCSEHIIGKWFWTSGSVQSGNLIPWNKEITNTLPQNFRWSDSNPTSITIKNSGYYKFEISIYCRKKPTIQIIVNGETIVSAVNSSSYVTHHSSGRLKTVGKGEVVGLGYIDYFLLPESAKIVIAYAGETPGQGFLSVQRV